MTLTRNSPKTGFLVTIKSCIQHIDADRIVDGLTLDPDKTAHSGENEQFNLGLQSLYVCPDLSIQKFGLGGWAGRWCWVAYSVGVSCYFCI